MGTDDLFVQNAIKRFETIEDEIRDLTAELQLKDRELKTLRTKIARIEQESRDRDQRIKKQLFETSFELTDFVKPVALVAFGLALGIAWRFFS